MLEMKYGRSVLTARAPASWNIQWLRPVPLKKRRDEAVVVRSALDHPVSSPRLCDFLCPDDLLTIIVSDKTRRCRTDLFLPLILERVHAAGVDDTNISIVFATGTHPPQTEIEQREILGDDVFKRYRIEQHDCHREEDGSSAWGRACTWVRAGTTRFGTEILLNPLVTGKRKIIATGTIVHHYFAGYGGGPKLFVPGCAAYSTAMQNHRRTLLEDGSFHPGCSDGLVDGNPVIEDIQDAVRFFPPTFYFAALLGEDGLIAAAVSGDLLAAHAEGARKVDEMYRIPVNTLSDITLVSAGGYPKDINLIQAHKAIHHAHYATREGGAIICLAQCAEGLGNSRFLDWFRSEADGDFRKRVLAHYSMNAHTAGSLREKTARYTIILVSSLDPAIVQRMGMIPAADLEEALSLADMRDTLAGQRNSGPGQRNGGPGLPGSDAGPPGSDPTVHMIENGSLIVPEYRER